MGYLSRGGRMMKVGFTGTQQGMTEAQILQLELQLSKLIVSEFHHGDCVGADAQAHFLASKLGIPIYLHPPLNQSKRAFCDNCHEVFEKKIYLERNKDIVDSVELLFVTPKEFREERRSGTWATRRYAKKKKIPVIIIYPDGSYVED
jgi:hypothetical protein